MYKIRIKDLNLAQIEDSGQCFRFIKNERPRLNPAEYADSTWQVIAFEKYLEISQIDKEEFILSCSQEEFETIWKSYFDLDTDYSVFKAGIDTKDVFLTNAVEYGWGIRILRQDLWEMLVSFIISQRKNIPAIRACLESLCQAYGQPIKVGEDIVYAFPSAERLYTLSLEELKTHSLGYRDKYISRLAKDVVEGNINLVELSQLKPEDATKALLNIYGIGIKVANCVSLFALHHIDAFPIDVWIQRIIDEEYEGHFDTSRYAGFAGVIQQYMFYYRRSY